MICFYAFLDDSSTICLPQLLQNNAPETLLTSQFGQVIELSEGVNRL